MNTFRGKSFHILKPNPDLKLTFNVGIVDFKTIFEEENSLGFETPFCMGHFRLLT